MTNQHPVLQQSNIQLIECSLSFLCHYEIVPFPLNTLFMSSLSGTITCLPGRKNCDTVLGHNQIEPIIHLLRFCVCHCEWPNVDTLLETYPVTRTHCQEIDLTKLPGVMD